jgi:molybdopterin converting factor small subunit
LDEKISEKVEKALDDYGKILEKRKKRSEDLLLTLSLEVNDEKGDITAEIEVEMFGRTEEFCGEDKVARIVSQAKKAVEELTGELSTEGRAKEPQVEEKLPSNNNASPR